MKKLLCGLIAVLGLAVPCAAIADDQPPGGGKGGPAQPAAPIPVVSSTCNTNVDGSATWAVVSVTMAPPVPGTTHLTATIAAGSAGASVDQAVFAPTQPLGPDRTVEIAKPGDQADWFFPFGSQATGSANVTITATSFDASGVVLAQVDGLVVTVPLKCVKLVTTPPVTPPPDIPPVTTPIVPYTPPVTIPPLVPPPTDTTNVPPVVPASKIVLGAQIVGPTKLKLGQTRSFTLAVFGLGQTTTVQLALNKAQLRLVGSSRENLPGPKWVFTGSGGLAGASSSFAVQLKAVRKGRSCMTAVVTATGADSASKRFCVSVS